MKHIGIRKKRPITHATSGAGLASVVAFSADLTRLSGGRVMFPRGVFRYKSHEEANAHEAACLAAGMAKLAKERKLG